MVKNATFRLPPLVARAQELTSEQLARAHRQLLLPGFGLEQQQRLRSARVLVIGAGGLGSASVPYLTGAGIGTIGILDDDVVELSNLHRQVTHRTVDLGRPKTRSLGDAAQALDPGVNVITHQVRLTSENALEIFAGYDLIIDGSDNFPTRYLSNDAAQLLGKPLVWGAILQYYGQVSVAWHEYGPGYRDLFPMPPRPVDVVSCGTGGVWPGLCGTVGSMLATEAAKIITGVGRPLIGRVALYDALEGSSREVAYSRDPHGLEVTELVDYDALCAYEVEQSASAKKNIECAEFVDLLRAGEPMVVVDVREFSEREAVNIPGSQWLPLSVIQGNANAPDSAISLGELREITEGNTVIVVCERDPRSRAAAQALVEQGITNVQYLRGGLRALVIIAPDLLSGSAML